MNDNTISLHQEKKPLTLMHIFIYSFIFTILATSTISYFFYNNDITRYSKAIRNEIKLLPPTQFEIDRWEKKDKELEIAYKRKEILALQMGLKLSDDTIDEARINHMMQYPDGHNPPKSQLQKLLNDAYHKRNELFTYSVVFSVALSMIVAIVYYFDKKKLT